MQNKFLFRKVIGITLSALLMMIPAQTVAAGVTEITEVPETKEEVPAKADGKICYYESPSGASSALVISNNETLLICFDADMSGLDALLQEKGADHIDSLIMASFSDTADETALKELHEAYPIGHIYASSGHAAVTPAGRLGIKTDYAEYLPVGNENVILYPDAAGNLGVLVFDETSSLFAADTMTDLSVLQDHQEIAHISTLSFSDRTGMNEEIISMMDPQTCIITGSIPEQEALSTFYHTDIADTQTFYISHFSPDGIEAAFSDLTKIRDAAYLHMPVPDPELFVVPEVETATDENGENGGNAGYVSAKQAIADAALRIWRGEIGQGQVRINTLRDEGFTDDDMKEIQRLVDKIASENLGACTAVIFDAGDHADDPDAQIVSIGSTASELQLSSNDEHYQFTGWYTDKECTEKFDFSTPVKDKTILYAGWQQLEEAQGEQPEQEAQAQQQTEQPEQEKAEQGETSKEAGQSEK